MLESTFEHVSLVSHPCLLRSSFRASLSLRSLETTVHSTITPYGITLDPLIQFDAAFAALIHDVDHQGVINATLVEENSPIAALSNNKHVVEQDSVDIAWPLLLGESFVWSPVDC